MKKFRPKNVNSNILKLKIAIGGPIILRYSGTAIKGELFCEEKKSINLDKNW